LFDDESFGVLEVVKSGDVLSDVEFGIEIRSGSGGTGNCRYWNYL
jgi:hypothetical protein